MGSMKLQQGILRGAILGLAVAGVLLAAQPWSKKDPSQWTADDVARVLGDSPWALPSGAIFGIQPDDDPPAPQELPGAAQAGLAGAQNSNQHWDGGVGRLDRYQVPTLNVTVRWDSALPERLALRRQQELGNGSAPPYTTAQADKDYIITVAGLVPAGRYHSVGQAETKSSSDDSVDARNPESMLEGLMQYSRLVTRAGAIRAEDAKLDAASGAIHLFFPRTHPITQGDKEVLFETRFGSLSVAQKFRLKDMLYRGRLEL